MPEVDARLGGSKTSLSASYTWGGLVSQQGLETRFRDVYQPGQGIFSPGYPLAPLEPERVRVWDYPVGVNTIYTPRAYEAISFEELRRLADAHDITRLAIETRKDQLERLDWAIRVAGDKPRRADAAARVRAVAEFWRRPDGERPFATWLRALMEDLLVLDAPCLELRRSRGGALIGLDIVDGATIKLLVDETGRRPRPPAPAFEQVIKGKPWKLLTTDDLLYWPRNPRPHKAYGFGPVEQIVMTVNIALRRQVMQLQHFTDGNVPPGLLNAPDGWNVEQISQFQEWFDSVLAGNTGQRTRLVWGPSGAKYQAFKEAPYKDDFDEWLAWIVCYAFSLPPTAFTKQVNRATAETAQDTAATEGLAPLMLWVKRLCDHVIQDFADEPDYPKEQAPMRFYAPIAKVDAEQRMVWGYASTEAEDDQGEIITRDALAAALGDYLKFANIREMHQMSAVGVAEEAGIDGKGLYVGARIVDPRAWDKVTSGVYKGFSVGGRVTSRDPHDRNVITALNLTEISLVDRPANPEAVFDCWKAEGAGDHMADDRHAIDYADPGFQADGRKRYPLDGERHIRAAWAFIHMANNAAPYTAGELDRIKARIVAAWKKEIDPAGPPAATGPTSNAVANQAALDHVHDCLKAMTGGDCCKAAKAAARHRGSMLGHLKEAHDALCRAGAKCDGFVAEPESDDGAEADKAARAGDLMPDGFMKAFAGEILPRLDALAKRVAELEATPLPPLTAAHAAAGLAKREDGFHAGATADDVVVALARMSGEERTLALIKAAHANPIRPFR